jgi:hypothetical protein
MNPSPNGDNGDIVPTRDTAGHFLKGNPGGPGNPQARNVATWRKALADTVTPEDVAEVTRKLVEAAKAGEPWAIHELFDRCMGKPNLTVAADIRTHEAIKEIDRDEALAALDAFQAAFEAKAAKPAPPTAPGLTTTNGETTP